MARARRYPAHWLASLAPGDQPHPDRVLTDPTEVPEWMHRKAASNPSLYAVCSVRLPGCHLIARGRSPHTGLAFCNGPCRRVRKLKLRRLCPGPRPGEKVRLLLSAGRVWARCGSSGRLLVCVIDGNPCRPTYHVVWRACPTGVLDERARYRKPVLAPCQQLAVELRLPLIRTWYLTAAHALLRLGQLVCTDIVALVGDFLGPSESNPHRDDADDFVVSPYYRTTERCYVASPRLAYPDRPDHWVAFRCAVRGARACEHSNGTIFSNRRGLLESIALLAGLPKPLLY